MRCADPAPLTSQIAADFGLGPLETFLEQSNVVTGHFGADGHRESAPPAEQTAAVELELDVGEFSYYEKIANADAACDDVVYADAHVVVRIGDGLLAFEADGRLWKGRHEPAAHFYAEADLLTAVGSYRPTLDVARIHVGRIDVALYLAPGQLRGDIHPGVAYFRDEAQLLRHRQGERLEYAERALLFSLGFPDDACEDHELPFAYDEAIEQLGGKSADEWRTRVIDVIGARSNVDAVWNDGRETEVAIEIGAPVADTVCLGKSYYPALASELALRIPFVARVRSADGRLDVPLEELVVGIDAGAVVRASARSRMPSAPLSVAQKEALDMNADSFSARLSYDLAGDVAAVDGIIELRAHTAPDRYAEVGCMAFPPGGKTDAGDCRFVPPAQRR